MAIPSDRYLDRDGTRLRYRDAGSGTPVIFIHGWTLDLDQWDLQAAALAADFRVIRFDRRGYGLSAGSPSIAADCVDLLALYEHLELGSAALVAMSQGVRVALHFATRSPQRVSCVVLDGPPNFGPAEVGGVTDLPYDHYRELAQTHGLEAFRREWSEHPLVRLRNSDAAVRDTLSRMMARYPGRDLTETPVSSGALEPLDFASFDRPTLVINGEFDLDSRKRFARYLTSQLSKVEYAQIPGSGHLSNLDNPRAYDRVLREFLRQHAVSSIAENLTP
jgi:pimeloyl-ACP methyl ester carboxylesterase